jgi:hypothetical protein
MKGYRELRDRVLGPDTQEDTVQTDYRILFNSPLGRKVLSHMLVELHFFDGILDNSEERVLHNYSISLLSRLGVWKAGNVEGVVGALMNLEPSREGGE